MVPDARMTGESNAVARTSLVNLYVCIYALSRIESRQATHRATVSRRTQNRDGRRRLPIFRGHPVAFRNSVACETHFSTAQTTCCAALGAARAGCTPYGTSTRFRVPVM